MRYKKTGSFVTIVAQGNQEEMIQVLQEKNPIFYEVVPLSIEEIFLCSMEGAGYDVNRGVF